MPLTAKHTTSRPQDVSADLGTSFSRLRRYELVGNADGSLAENALDILFANKFLTKSQTLSGHAIAQYRVASFGSSNARIGRLQNYVSSSAPHFGSIDSRPNDYVVEMAREYIESAEALRKAGRSAELEVNSVAIKGDLPRWFRRARLGQDTRRDIEEREALLRGLDALTDYYESTITWGR